MPLIDSARCPVGSNFKTVFTSLKGSSLFIFVGSKITAGGDYRHEIKRRLLLGRKAMTNLDSVLKSSPLPTKVCLVKAMVFPVVLYGFESLNMKKAEAEELMLLNCGVREDS